MTPRQIEVLETIKAFRAERGFSPTFAEIARKLGISVVSIHLHIKALMMMGAIRSVGYKAIRIADEIPYTETQLTIAKAFASNPGATHGDIARMLGIKPPTLTEHLHNLAALGAIEFSRGKVIVKDASLGPVLGAL